jgi:type II secretory pathway predicted ATPase ExeA
MRRRRVGLFDGKGQDAPGFATAPDTSSEQRSREARSARCASPFGETADPDQYVPRDATEAALRELERLVSQARPAALISAPGLGKTLLLHLLAGRLGYRLRFLYMPYGAMELGELCAWVLGRLEQPVEGDPAQALHRYATAWRSQGGRALVLLIDDASSLSLETARALGLYVRAAGGALRLVLAAADDAASSRAVAAVDRNIVEVRLAPPMSPAETRLYVQSHLQWMEASRTVSSRFDPPALERIYHLSGGIPRLVNQVASWLASDLPADVHPGWRDQDWAGAPLDELSGDPGTVAPPDCRDILELPDVLLEDDLE